MSISKKEEKEEDAEPGGSRILMILLFAAAAISVLYLAFRPANVATVEQSNADNKTENSSKEIKNSRLQVLEEFSVRDTKFSSRNLLESDKVFYVKDFDSQICYLTNGRMSFMTDVPCHLADPKLRKNSINK